jgi:molybdenum cofactor cytidylyltransferase
MISRRLHRVQSRDTNSIKVGVVILAAGASRRMGEPKLLLPWGRTSVLGHLLAQWPRLHVQQTAVVLAAGAEPIVEELNRLNFPESNRIFNPSPDEGMFSSIQAAANWPGWHSSLTHWVITLGDQPHLKEATLQELLRFGVRNPDKIWQPMRGERRKHPVLLSKRFFHELKKSPVGDLKMFLVERAADLSGFQSSDAGLDFDMDTREDYEHVKQLVPL